MAALTLQAINAGSNSISYAAAASGGDTMPYVPNAFLGVKNDDASPKQVTITAQTTSASTGSLAGTLTISNIVVSVPAGEERQIGVPAAYSNAGTISITYDAVTSLTVAAQYAKV